MNIQQKINQLRLLLETKLTPLINNNYILLDVPYYSNIGDILIWEGERQFLNKIPYKCLFSKSIYTFTKQPLSKETIILLQGGGNFGDIWRHHQEFRLKIIKEYPDNKIIILPQTIHYDSLKTMEADANLMLKHSNLHICARDKISFDILNKYFGNNHYLLPDMAFCIFSTSLNQFRQGETEKTLFLKRTDKELSNNSYTPVVQNELDVRDWPSMEALSSVQQYFQLLHNYQGYIAKIIGCSNTYSLIDFFASHYYRSNLIKQGVNFVSSYKDIYTTRLHVAILSILLHKECKFIDNSYGKNSSFFDTWLQDVEGVEFIRK